MKETADPSPPFATTFAPAYRGQARDWVPFDYAQGKRDDNCGEAAEANSGVEKAASSALRLRSG